MLGIRFGSKCDLLLCCWYAVRDLTTRPCRLCSSQSLFFEVQSSFCPQFSLSSRKGDTSSFQVATVFPFSMHCTVCDLCSAWKSQPVENAVASLLSACTYYNPIQPVSQGHTSGFSCHISPLGPNPQRLYYGDVRAVLGDTPMINQKQFINKHRFCRRFHKYMELTNRVASIKYFAFPFDVACWSQIPYWVF